MCLCFFSPSPDSSRRKSVAGKRREAAVLEREEEGRASLESSRVSLEGSRASSESNRIEQIGGKTVFLNWTPITSDRVAGTLFEELDADGQAQVVFDYNDMLRKFGKKPDPQTGTPFALSNDRQTHFFLLSGTSFLNSSSIALFFLGIDPPSSSLAKAFSSL